MALRLPAGEDLQQLAAASHFRLSAEELTDCQALMPAMFQTLDALDRMPPPLVPLKYSERDAGSRPDPMGDPFTRSSGAVRPRRAVRQIGRSADRFDVDREEFR
jgi:hypothetical protein